MSDYISTIKCLEEERNHYKEQCLCHARTNAEMAAEVDRLTAELDDQRKSPARQLGDYMLSAIEAMGEVDREQHTTVSRMADAYIQSWQKMKGERDKAVSELAEARAVMEDAPLVGVDNSSVQRVS